MRIQKQDGGAGGFEESWPDSLPQLSSPILTPPPPPAPSR